MQISEIGNFLQLNMLKPMLKIISIIVKINIIVVVNLASCRAYIYQFVYSEYVDKN